MNYSLFALDQRPRALLTARAPPQPPQSDSTAHSQPHSRSAATAATATAAPDFSNAVMSELSKQSCAPLPLPLALAAAALHANANLNASANTNEQQSHAAAALNQFALLQKQPQPNPSHFSSPPLATAALPVAPAGASDGHLNLNLSSKARVDMELNAVPNCVQYVNLPGAGAHDTAPTAHQQQKHHSPLGIAASSPSPTAASASGIGPNILALVHQLVQQQMVFGAVGSALLPPAATAATATATALTPASGSAPSLTLPTSTMNPFSVKMEAGEGGFPPPPVLRRIRQQPDAEDTNEASRSHTPPHRKRYGAALLNDRPPSAFKSHVAAAANKSYRCTTNGGRHKAPEMASPLPTQSTQQPFLSAFSQTSAPLLSAPTQSSAPSPASVMSTLMQMLSAHPALLASVLSAGGLAGLNSIAHAAMSKAAFGAGPSGGPFGPLGPLGALSIPGQSPVAPVPEPLLPPSQSAIPLPPLAAPKLEHLLLESSAGAKASTNGQSSQSPLQVQQLKAHLQQHLHAQLQARLQNQNQTVAHSHSYSGADIDPLGVRMGQPALSAPMATVHHTTQHSDSFAYQSHSHARAQSQAQPEVHSQALSPPQLQNESGAGCASGWALETALGAAPATTAACGAAPAEDEMLAGRTGSADDQMAADLLSSRRSSIKHNGALLSPVIALSRF